jgi:UDP-glucose 4-epimerase
VEWIDGDLSDPTTCDRLLRDQDVLIHLAWRGVPLASRSYATGLCEGLLQTAHLLDAARRQNDLRIVFASSGGTVYADRGDRSPHREEDVCLPTSAYAIQKLTAEHYLQLLCAEGRTSARILRIATGYGWVAEASAQQGFIGVAVVAAVARKPVRLIGDPENVRDFIHSDDIAKALILAATRPFAKGTAEVLNIGTGVGASVRQVVSLIKEELGQPVTVYQEHWETARNLPSYAVLDVTRARDVLGWTPSIALRDGIRRSLREIRGLAQNSVPLRQNVARQELAI